ncbi:helix-turn-helix transcriptional regulator [Actinokineospora bangkokensis]|uniref:HTH luxR-type domain-containing protein n=1 Tax=Actinokineospora bangkokensis TaxID=1193682 RepID=A0A1Q9LND4_9PSEU|nr:LuxR family transcriptional regulator [Actinokineospora bangkokensis]OLR93552.1 hypothetical protein BJP25_14755 [Actinokineospora bangkokensis]
MAVWNPVRGKLVGRDDVWASGLSHLASARAGDGHALLLHGAAGMGKSSLLAALADAAGEQDVTVLRAACGEDGRTVAFGAVRQLLGAYAEPDHLDDGLWAGSARLALPVLRPEGGDEPAADSYAVLHGLYWLVANLAARGPLMLCVDDVQRCDEASLRWLGHLLRRAAALPVLVAVTCRTGPDCPGDHAEALPGVAVVEIGPLTPEDVAVLVTLEYGTEADPGFSARCGQATGGNPLLLHRLVTDLRRGGVQPEATAVDEVSRLGPALTASVLSRLSPDALAVAHAVAVLGREPDLLAPFSGRSEAVVASVLELLRGAEVLRPGSLEFTHDLVRAAVLGTIGDAQLARLREQAAQLLNDTGRPAETVAGQLLHLPTDGPGGAGQPWMRVVLRDAAAAARRRGAPAAAARYLEPVAAAVPEDVVVKVELAKVLAQLQPRRAIELLERAMEQVPVARASAPVAIQLGMTALGAHTAPQAFRVLGDVLDRLDAELGPEPTGEDRVLRTLVESMLVLTGMDEKSTIQAVWERVRHRRPPAGDTPVERQLLAMYAAAGTLAGDSAATVVGHARRSLRTDDIGVGGWVVLASALPLYLADELDTAHRALDTLIEHAQRRGEAWTYCLALSTRSQMWHFAGNLVEAFADAQSAHDLAVGESWGAGATMPQIALADVLVHRGELDRAEDALSTITRRRFDQFALEYHHFLITRGRLRRARGDSEGALDDLRTCGDSLADSGIRNPLLAPWWLEATEVLAEQDRAGEAAPVVAVGAELAENWGTPRAIGLALLARGLAAGAGGRDPLGTGAGEVDLLTEAVETLAGTPARLELARAEYHLGSAHLRRGDQPEARKHLRTALDACVRCGDRVLLESARQALLEAGGRLRSSLESPVDALSGREIRVAQLAATGHTNREIAESLFITVRTVEVHLTSAYRKLGVRRRSDLSGALSNRDGAGTAR